MAMVVQHNLAALNANNKMNVNVAGLKKSTEKLSSGYQINRAGDNASGLAVSEKMRSQIRGLGQATKNANDAISLIQTAEGGLNEDHSILQRMRELAVQSANGTYTQKDRDAIQLEVDALKDEIDRISTSTEYNTMQLLDGSLSGASSSGEYGPRYGTILDTDNGDLVAGSSLTSSVQGVSVSITQDASGKGGENAFWDATGKELTINLAKSQSYTQSQIDDLIKNANVTKDSDQKADVPDVKLTLGNGVITANSTSAITATAAGVRSDSGEISLKDALVSTSGMTDGYADSIKLTANSYGKDERTIKLSFDSAAGKEYVEAATANAETSYKRNGTYTLHLATGTEYTEKDIENLLAKNGLDYTVTLTDQAKAPDGDTKLYANKKPNVAIDIAMTGTTGAGVFKDAVASEGEGLTFQIGANGVEDQRVTLNIQNMSASSLGVRSVDVSQRNTANAAIDTIDEAIGTVSMQRAALGALQNRLEYTVNNLTTTNENLTDAESTIRDTDMATEMISYTKFNILQQASQAMLAQANQQPQAVLQLLG